MQLAGWLACVSCFLTHCNDCRCKIECVAVLSAELCGLGHLLGGAAGNHWRLCAQLHQGGGERLTVILSAEECSTQIGKGCNGSETDRRRNYCARKSGPQIGLLA